MNNEERMVDVETRLAYQEDTLDELNKRVFRQQLVIDELTETCKRLIERFNELADTGTGEGAEQADTRPPHY